MKRTVAREIAVHFVYELDFGSRSSEDLFTATLTPAAFEHISQDLDIYGEYPNEAQKTYIEKVVQGVSDHGPELDQYIAQYAVGWSFERIPRIIVAVMRVAMYEILYMPEIPNKVSINEAVNIAKNYEDEETVAFMNGILGSFVRAEFPEKDNYV